MFSNNTGFGFGSSQQQTGTTGGGAFGSGGGFGSTPGTGFGQASSGGGFGATTTAGTGIFGQPQQSNSFGGTGFGTTANSPFGQKSTFGSGTSTAGTGLFGSTPGTTTSTGFGGFGSTATSGTGTFGSTTPSATSGIFGTKPAFGSATSAPSTTGSLFGTAGSSTGAGFNAGGFGTTPTATTTECPGTGGTTFSPFVEKDAASSMMNHFHTITFLPQYHKWSLEELRMADYLQGRRFPTGGSFGQGTGFGTGGFGSSSTTGTGFGPTAPSGGGLFSSGAAGTSGGFGSGTTGFGAATSSAPTSSSIFGKPSGTGIFGSATPSTGASGGGLFGGQQNTTAGGFGTGTGGAFGTQSQPAANGGLFGSNSQTTNAGTQGTGAFGTTPQSTGFGTGTTGSGGGLFVNQQSGTATGFGTATAPSATGFSGFVQPNQPQTQTGQSPFGGFGAPAQQQAKPFGFGVSTTPSTGGLFGQTSTTTPQAAQTGGGIFGSKPGGFGATSTPAAGGGLFGGTGATGVTAGGGLFGTQPQQQQQQQQATTGGGIFGNTGQTTAGSIFGGNKPSGTGFFGSTTPAPTTTGGGIFGSGFGSGATATSQQQQQPTLGGSLFSGSTIQQGQQPQTFTASIHDANPYGQAPLMAQVSGSPIPLATPIGSVQKKKAAMLPHNKIAPRAPQLAPRLGCSYSRSGSPFTASSSGNTMFEGSLRRSFSAGSNKPHLFDSDDSLLSSGAFTPSNNNRVASLKRLVIDKNIRDQDLFTGGGDVKVIKESVFNDGKPKSILKKMVSFDSGVNVRRDGDITDEPGSRSSGQALSSSAQLSPEELGFLRSPKGKDKAGEQAPASIVNTEGQQTKADDTALIEEGGEVVKHGDYWMVPSVETLKKMEKDKLKKVTNLTVGRKGYGQIRFEPAIDLSEIIPEDIPGGIVEFDQRVCTVYPEHLPKPPPGKGLNVPAIISLEDCFPQYRENRAPVKNPEHPRYQTHLKRLKSIADTEFIDYIANDGIWIFKVQHFTTYGLVEDDDHEEADREGNMTATDTTITDTTITESEEEGDDTFAMADGSFEQSIDNSIVGDESSIDDELNESSSNMEDTFEFRKYPPGSLASSMQSQFTTSIQSRSNLSNYSGSDSYFSESEDKDITIIAEEGPFLGESSANLAEESETQDESTELDRSDGVDESVVINTDINQMDLLPPSPAKKVLDDDGFGTPKTLPLARNWTEQLNLTISPVKKRKGSINQSIKISLSKSMMNTIQPSNYGHLDMGNDLFSVNPWERGVSVPKGREGIFKELPCSVTPNAEHGNHPQNSAVRPVWTVDGKILYEGELVDALKKRQNFPQASALKTAKLPFAPKDNDLASLLRLQFQSTEVKRDRYQIPFAELDPSTSFASFAEAPWNNTLSSYHEQSVWRLASILFDPIDLSGFPITIDEHILEQRLRKEQLSRFFEELVERSADEHVQNAQTKEEAALAHLTGHRIEQACAALLDARCFRLATLIPLVGGDRRLRQDISEQIAEWRDRGVLSEMSIPVRALYELLAGNTCYSEGLTKPYEDAVVDFYFSKKFELDWKRYFGLKLWYGTTEDQPISDAVEIYEQDMATYPAENKVVRPKAWLSLDPDFPADSQAHAEDLLWGLLKIYSYNHARLEQVLNPYIYGSDFIDYRLAWQLRTIMSRKGICDFTDSEDKKNEDISAGVTARLTIDFASQLEASGHWEWALFAIIHLNDADSREDAIKKILGRHVSDFYGKTLNPENLKTTISKEVFLTQYLLMPMEWIYETKALHARFVQDHVAEAEYLLQARNWVEAHKAVVQQVAPDAVISGELSALRDLLNKFGGDGKKIQSWELGGRVYLDYISLCAWKDSEGRSSPAGSNIVPVRIWTSVVAQEGSKQLEEVKNICTRLLEALPNMERVKFKQRVAVAEMGRVVSAVVIKSNTMTTIAPKILSLPLTEDEYLKKTTSLTLGYYRSKLQRVVEGVR